MVRIFDINVCKGFIKDVFLNAQNSCSVDDMKHFANLDNDIDRFRFASEIDCIKNYEIKRTQSSMKSARVSQNFKQKGNVAFQQKKWPIALELYNKSLIMTPENDENFAVTLANRSAALYHLAKYDHALSDIQNAEENNYPKEMLHKLKERKAKCYLAKNDLERALQAFKDTVTHLDNSKMPMEKRGKLEKDAQIMIKMLPRQIETEKKFKKMMQEKKDEDKIVDKLSSKVIFEYNENEGRYAKAVENIDVGEEILRQKPHVSTLFEMFSKSHCQNCFQRILNPLPCRKCIDVVFCSKECQLEANAAYHSYECGILETLWSSGSSINGHMALRIITQKPLKYFKGIRKDLRDDLSYDEIKNLPVEDYRRVYNLVRHEERRESLVFFQYAFMSRFLVNLLKVSNYFVDNELENDQNDIDFIGSLILRNLQFLQFNSHEIFDLLKTKESKITQTASIGAGIYPSLALFNHSCNPSFVRYFKRTIAHVHAIKMIKNGENIAENYGPLYSQHGKQERQDNLKYLYWFDCNCEACEQNWPVFEDMNTNEIRFKCNGSESCNNIITVSIDCSDFMIQCIECGQYTNILKGLKAVQDTELMERTAKRLYAEGNIDKSLQKYIEIMKIFDDVMAPPFQDYCKCQQSIKDCLLEYGNKLQVD